MKKTKKIFCIITAIFMQFKPLLASNDIKEKNMLSFEQLQDEDEDTENFGIRGGLVAFSTMFLLSIYSAGNIVEEARQLEDNKLCPTIDFYENIVKETLFLGLCLPPSCALAGLLEAFYRKKFLKEPCAQSYKKAAINGAKVAFLIPIACYFTLFN